MRHKRRVDAGRKSGETQGRMSIYATLYPNDPIPKGEKLVAHTCGKCDTGFAVIANTKPYCPQCGTHHVHASTEREIAPIANLVAAKCEKCGSHSGMSRQTASAFGGHMHCVTCGTGMTFELPRAVTSNLGTETNDQTLEQETNMAAVDKKPAAEKAAANVKVLASALKKHLASDDGQDVLGEQDELTVDGQQDQTQQQDASAQDQQEQQLREDDDKEFSSLLDQLEQEPTVLEQAPAQTPAQLPVDASATAASVADDAAAAADASKNTDDATNQDACTTTAAATKETALAEAGPDAATETKIATPAPAVETTDVDTDDAPNEGADRGLLGGDAATVLSFMDDEVLEQMADLEENPQARDEIDQQIELSMVAVAKLGGHDKFTIRSSGDQVLAFLGPMHVATLEKATAGENANVMHTAGFHKAVTAAVNEDAKKTTAALTDLGFNVVKARLPYVKAARAMVERASRKVTASVDTSKKEMAADLKQCMTIAAAALTKGFFAADENPLKSSFYEVLAGAGVKNPAKLIDDVFRRSADSYNSSVMARALDLMAKPIEVRNSISDAVVASAYITAEQMMQNEQDQEMAGPQDNFGGKKAPPFTSEDASADADDQDDEGQEQQFAGMRPTATKTHASVRRNMSHASVHGTAETARAKFGSLFARTVN